MQYIAAGILIGIGIMLAPILMELTFTIIRAIPVVLFSTLALAAVAAGIYGVGYVVFENATNEGFWILVTFSAIASFVFFWPRRRTDGVQLVRARGLLAGLLILLVFSFSVMMLSILLAVIVMQNWRDPAFWLGCAVFLGIAAFVVLAVSRERIANKD